MNTTKLIESLPPRIKDHVIEYQDVILKGGKPAMRVLLDCILSPGQKALLQGNKHIIGLECRSGQIRPRNQAFLLLHGMSAAMQKK